MLLDTNVVSELMRPAPSPAVVGFVTALTHAAISVVTLHELYFGVDRMPAGKKKSNLSNRLEILRAQFGDSLLSITSAEAMVAAQIRNTRRTHGQPINLPDALIAATAQVHGLTLATRNVRDFAHLGLTISNPWQASD